MFVHFAKKISVSVAGQVIKEVVCDKCNSHFWYELRRQYIGSATAHYYLFQDAARKRAAKAANAGLQRRLSRESEMVPCPACHWVNDRLVADYRRSLFRECSSIAWGLLAVGLTVAAAFGACLVMHVGNPHEVGAWAVGLFLAATGSWALLMTTQRLLGLRVNPNSNFPGPPVMPVGTPVALVERFDAKAGAVHLLPAAPVEGAIDEGGADLWVVFQPGQIHFPDFCCVCMRAATSVYRTPFTLDESSDVNVPLCHGCACRLGWRWWLIALVILIVIIGASVYISRMVDVFDEVGRYILFGMLGFVAALILLPTLPAALTRPYRFKVLDRTRGIMKLSAQNREFTKLLIAQVKERQAQ